MNITELFLSAANKYPDKMAIIDPKESISYNQLSKEVKTTATYFIEEGVKKGDRVLVFVPMGVDLYRIVLALFYIGATAVFLDEWVSKKRLEICCELADCKAFIGVFKARVLGLFSKQLRGIPLKLKLKKQSKNEVPIVQVEPEETALITFTTGSTGVPKAANRTHGFLKEQFDALLDEIDPKVDDIDMPVLPILLFVNLGVGCTSVIANFKVTKPETIKVDVIIDQLQQYKVNRIIASPFFIKKLAQYVIEQNINLTDLKKVFTGGAPVFPFEATLYIQAFKAAKTTIVYGSTEAEPISSIDAKELTTKDNRLISGLPVGDPYHKVKIKIIKISAGEIKACSIEELNGLSLENGEIGEIIVAGKHVLKKYFKNEEAFKQNKILVGDTVWHRTGDSGLMIKEQLYLLGRCKQLIQTSEGYLSPFIIENQLQSINGVEIGTLMQINNKNILVLQSKCDIGLLKEELMDIQYDDVLIIDKIPRDQRHNSKIDYENLKLMLKYLV